MVRGRNEWGGQVLRLNIGVANGSGTEAIGSVVQHGAWLPRLVPAWTRSLGHLILHPGVCFIYETVRIGACVLGGAQTLLRGPHTRIGSCSMGTPDANDDVGRVRTRRTVFLCGSYLAGPCIE